jgi:ABC-type multidrug transport system fused ATPase/permease subunit
MNLLSTLVPGVYQGLIYLLVVAALGGLYLVGGGQVASLGAVVLLLVRAGMYGQQVQAAYGGLRQTLPYLERLQEAQRRYRASIPAEGKRPLEAVRQLAFQSVSFSYQPGLRALSHIEFEVFAGEAIGIVGPSGAGKSTLVQLLLKLRTPDSGRYLVNGVPADEFSHQNWHLRFSYVPQEPNLLHDSVAENIRFFRELGDDAVERAARLAGIHDDVMKWPRGYHTLVGPRADAISGGQQQRICLARALAGNPDVLVLDEPTSALDPHAEFLIQESLAALKHKLTLFVVAHRMSTLDICERVMVVRNGRLEAFDRIEALRADNAYYRSVSGDRHPPPAIAVRARPSKGPA